MEVRYLSLFSGVEAATQAWKPLGWKCVGVSEIEPFPCAVLAHHYPDVPNLGDVTKITEDDIKALGKIDLIVFGSPCQNLSVAGNRKGFDGSESSLFYEAMRIINYARKHNDVRFALWENVPGAFSSNKGRDFGEVVKYMAGLEDVSVPAYGWGKEGVALGDNGLLEWAVLDAQHFGVAQRRRRVFAIVDFGNWTSRRPILIEREGLRGDTPPVRETRETVTADVRASTEARAFTPVSSCLYAAYGTKWNGNGAAYDGSLFAATTKASGGCLGGGSETLAVAAFKAGQGAKAGGIGYQEEVSPTLTSADSGSNRTPCVVKHLTVARLSSGNDVSGTLSACNGDKQFLGNQEAFSGDFHAVESVAYPISMMNCQGGEGLGVTYSIVADITPKIGEEINGTLRSQGGGGIVPPSVAQGSVVRRLTPIECERLQGFPDDFTRIPYRNKPADQCPDGPRYKAMGNSMAVPVMQWIGEQVDEVLFTEELIGE